MNATHLAWLAGCLPLGAAAGWTARRLSGEGPAWLLPTAAGGQVMLGLWTVTTMPPPWWPASFLLGWGLLVLALVDVLDFRLPDALTLPLTAVGLLLSAGSGAWSHHLMGAMLGWGMLTGVAAAYRRWRGRDGMGQGDAKLLAAGGAWLGWEALPSVVLIACAIAFAGVAANRLAVARPRDTDAPVPFGPALCGGIWLMWLYG